VWVIQHGWLYDCPHATSGELTPSPLDYKPDMSKVRKSSSSFTFGVKPTPEHLKSKTPGPGQYEPGRWGEGGGPGSMGCTS
jgi:hypothetical protein